MKLFVLTNKLGDVARDLLRGVELAAPFEKIVGDEDGFARKPAPDGLRHLLDSVQASADASFMVGDGIPDVEVGLRVGVTTLACGWGYTDPSVLQAMGPTHLLSAPSDIPAKLLDAREL